MRKLQIIIIALIASGCTVDAEFSGTATEEFTRSISPAKLSFKSGSDNGASPDTCSDAIEVEILAASGNAVGAIENTTINLSTDGSGQFFSDSSCSTSMASIQLSKGDSSFTFYYKESSVGTYTLNASTSELLSDSMEFNILAAGTPYRLSIDTIANTTAGSILNAGAGFNVNILDIDNALVTTATNSITLSLIAAPAHTPPAPTPQINGTFSSVAAVGGIATFNLAHIEAAGSGYRIQANEDSSSLVQNSVDSNVFQIDPDSPTQLLFTTLPPTTTDAVSTWPVSFALRDAYSNLATNVSEQVQLVFENNPTATTLGSSPVIVSGGVASFTGVSIQQPGSPYRIQGAGMNTLSGLLSSASSDITVSAGPLSRFELSGPTTGVTTDCVSFSIQSQDAVGNIQSVGSAQALTLSSTSGSASFFTEPSCSSTSISSVSISAATSAATFYLNDPIAGIHDITIDHTTLTGDSQQIVLTNPLVTVDATYSAYQHWNDYIRFWNTAEKPWAQSSIIACPSTLSGANLCLHTGIYKKIDTGISGSCTNWTLSESQQWFDWICDDTTTVTYYSTGLKPGISLDDLIDSSGASFKDNSVTLHDGTYYYESTSDVWWSNPVIPAPPSAGTHQVLNTYRAIYTVAGPGEVETSGYIINADKIGFLVKSGATLKLADNSLPNCNPATGLYSGTGRTCVLSIGSSSGSITNLWIEGNFDGAANGISTGSDSNVIVAVNMNFSRFENVGVQNAQNMGLFLNNSNSNIFLKLSVSNSGTRGVFGRDGVSMVSSSDNIFQNLRGFNNSRDGMQIIASDRNTIKDSIFASNQANGLSFTANSSKSNVVNVTSVNNGAIGIVSDNAGISNVFQNILSANNSNLGIKIASPAPADTVNLFTNLALLDNGQGGVNDGGIQIYNSRLNRFAGSFLNNNNGGSGNCVVTNFGTEGLIDGTCLSGGAWPSVSPLPSSNAVYNDSSSLRSDNAFVEIATSDSSNAHPSASSLYSLISDFLTFDNLFRGWGLDSGSNYPSASDRGRCGMSDNCAIWDYRLLSSGTVVRNTTYDGASQNQPFGSTCPSQLFGDEVAESYNISYTVDSIFMKHATEILFDNVGDDDGICENNEDCHYTPNYGAYQGQGISYDNSCAFSSATVYGVRIYSSGINGI